MGISLHGSRLALLARQLRPRFHGTLDETTEMPGISESITLTLIVFGTLFITIGAVQMLFVIGPRSLPGLIGAEMLYFSSLALVVLARMSSRVRDAVCLSLAAVATAAVLDLMTGSDWGTLTLYAVAVTATFRLRWQVALWPVVPAALLLIYTEGLAGVLFEHRSGSMLITTLLILLFALSASAGQRSRALLITRLRRTTGQLRLEMTRTAELATSQERARIARDIHDVLAHSLTTLSIQVQAARQVVRDQPERAAALLDEMAGVLRESQAESRQVVSLLRAAAIDGQAQTALARLLIIADRFAERTGVRCAVAEEGSPLPLDEPRLDALCFALREALTNAYRHGGARQVAAVLRWRADGVELSMRNDGEPTSRAPDSGSGQGLRGMRERAKALGGAITAGPDPARGFTVRMELPVAGDAAVEAAQ